MHSATSVSTAIKDTSTGETVAVTLYDFVPYAFIKALGPENTIIGSGQKGFPIVVTPETNIFAGDTVIGPDYDMEEDGPQTIQNVSMREDQPGSENWQRFAEALRIMREGGTGNVTFVRTVNGNKETAFLSYAPVRIDIFDPIDNRNFSAGCNVSTKLVYSLGIAVAQNDLYLRYREVEDAVDTYLDIARGLCIAGMVILAICFEILTYFISLNIIRPIIALTKIVKSIKNKSLRDEIPDVEGGSREVTYVHESFQRLMKVVRFSNTAFFAGDRTRSYHCMVCRKGNVFFVA